jgi:hypothetical protein
MTARDYGKLRVGRWRETEWLKLSADAQWLYVFLVSQSTTDSAGVFPIQLSKWAKGASDMTVERVTAAARLLDAANFIVVDHDTEEGLIRTYIRDDRAGDNVFKGALSRAAQAQSPLLREVLLREIKENLHREFTDREAELITQLEATLSDHVSSATTPTPSTATTTPPFEDSQETVATEFEQRSPEKPERWCGYRELDGTPCGEFADGDYGLWCKYHETHWRTDAG